MILRSRAFWNQKAFSENAYRDYLILKTLRIYSLNQLLEHDYVCRIVETPEEAKELIEVGFEFVNEVKGKWLYRKLRRTFKSSSKDSKNSSKETFSQTASRRSP